MADTGKTKGDGKQTNRFISYVWNQENGTIFGRTGISWGLISVFYLGLYLALGLFFLICMTMFSETLDGTFPKWTGEDSLTQDNPGIALRPMPQYDTTLIRFEQGKPSSYKPYTDHMEAFLLPYEDSAPKGREQMECVVSEGARAGKDIERACRVDLDKILGKCTKEQDFGFETGEPCILLKMNRVIRYTPIPYETEAQLLEDNGLQKRPRFLAFTPNITIGVSCEGEGPADRENIMDGGIEFFPSKGKNFYEGIPTIFFPYLNQEGYQSPFIMVKFNKFSKRVIIQIVCKLYAKNIDNSGGSRRHGTLRFELLKD